MNPQYGIQFEIETFMEVVSRTREGIIGYLSSDAIPGIGKKTAETIFSYFGLETLEIIEMYRRGFWKSGVLVKKAGRDQRGIWEEPNIPGVNDFSCTIQGIT